ncbi:unnamed protein product, partial [Urochloa humidicola]
GGDSSSGILGGGSICAAASSRGSAGTTAPSPCASVVRSRHGPARWLGRLRARISTSASHTLRRSPPLPLVTPLAVSEPPRTKPPPSPRCHGEQQGAAAKPPAGPPPAAAHHYHQQRRPFQPPARTMATPLGSVGSTHCFAMMDDYYMDALNAALVGISGEDLLDEAQGVGRADSSMSGFASPPPVPRKVLATEQKRLQMDAEKKEKEEDERMFILFVCHVYYRIT